MDYISKEDALGSICIDCSAQRDCRPGERCVDYMRIKAIPAADVREVRRGKWQNFTAGQWVFAECSECGTFQNEKSNFCPNCGASMLDGEEQT